MVADRRNRDGIFPLGWTMDSFGLAGSHSFAGSARSDIRSVRFRSWNQGLPGSCDDLVARTPAAGIGLAARTLPVDLRYRGDSLDGTLATDPPGRTSG